MKRTIACLLIVVLLLPLVACGQNQTTESKSETADAGKDENPTKKSEAEIVQHFSEMFLQSHTLWFSKEEIIKIINGATTENKDLNEVASFVAPYYKQIDSNDGRSLLTLLLSINAYFALYHDSSSQNHIAVYLPCEVLESAGIEGTEKNIFFISVLASENANQESMAENGIAAIRELMTRYDENKYFYDIIVDMTAFPPSVPIYDPIVSEWLIPMLLIYDHISEASDQFQKIFTNGMDLPAAKEALSVDYLDGIGSLITEIRNIPITGTDLDKYNAELEDALLSFQQFCARLHEIIESPELTQDDEILTEYSVLSRLNDYEELDRPFHAYSDNVNQTLREITGYDWDINIDFSITLSIYGAITDSNRKVLWHFAHDYLPTLESMGHELDSALVNDDDDKLLAMGRGLNYYRNTADPYYRQLQTKFNDTLLEETSNSYGIFLDDYFDALDYSLTSVNDLAEMADSISNQDRLLRWDFYQRLEPFFQAHDWRFIDERGNGRSFLDDSYSGGGPYYNRFLLLYNHSNALAVLSEFYDHGADLSVFTELFTNYSIDEVYVMYTNALKEAYLRINTEVRDGWFLYSLKLSEEEYVEVKALAESGISTSDFELKQATVQQTVKAKIEEYQRDYYDFVYMISGLAESFGISLIDLINNPYERLEFTAVSSFAENPGTDESHDTSSFMPARTNYYDVHGELVFFEDYAYYDNGRLCSTTLHSIRDRSIREEYTVLYFYDRDGNLSDTVSESFNSFKTHDFNESIEQERFGVDSSRTEIIYSDALVIPTKLGTKWAADILNLVLEQSKEVVKDYPNALSESRCRFAFIDNDSIPELWIDYGGNYGGIVYTSNEYGMPNKNGYSGFAFVYNDTVQWLNRGNLLYTRGEYTKTCYDIIFVLDDGNVFSVLADGKINTESNDYFWRGSKGSGEYEQVSKAGYQFRLSSIFDSTQLADIHQCVYSYEQCTRLLRAIGNIPECE